MLKNRQVFAFYLLCLTVSCAGFDAVEGRRNQFVESLDREIAAFDQIAATGPDKVTREQAADTASDLAAVRVSVLQLKGAELTRPAVLAQEGVARNLLRQATKKRERTQVQRRLLAKAQALAAHEPPAANRTWSDQVQTLVGELQTEEVQSPTQLEKAEEKVKELAQAAEGQEPDRVAQQKLRDEVARLQERVALLRGWSEPERAKTLEAVRATVDKLVKAVPDPAVTPLPTKARTEAELQAAAAREEIAKLETDVRILSAPWFRMHTGAISTSPYVLQPTGGTPAYQLRTTGSNTAIYAELDFHNRRAWLHPDDRFVETSDTSDFWRALMPEDHEIRLRFVNDRTSAADDGGATAASASGDINLEGSIGWSIQDFSVTKCAACELDPSARLHPAGSINIEVHGGVATDRDRIDASRFLEAGIGSAWSFPMQVADQTYRQATVFSGIYYGVHQFPRVDADDSVYTLARRPHFNDLGALGVKVDFTVPLTQNVEFVAGARYFSALGHDEVPDDWQVFLGVSLPIGKLLRGLSTSDS